MTDQSGVARRSVLAAALGIPLVATAAQGAQSAQAEQPVYQSLSVETRGPILIIRLNWPADDNVVDGPALRELPQVWILMHPI